MRVEGRLPVGRVSELMPTLLRVFKGEAAQSAESVVKGGGIFVEIRAAQNVTSVVRVNQSFLITLVHYHRLLPILHIVTSSSPRVPQHHLSVRIIAFLLLRRLHNEKPILPKWRHSLLISPIRCRRRILLQVLLVGHFLLIDLRIRLAKVIGVQKVLNCLEH